MEKFLTGNEWNWRLARTVVQGVLGVVVANVDMIVGAAVLDPAARALCVAFVMAVLSPVMAEIGAHLGDDGSAGAGGGSAGGQGGGAAGGLSGDAAGGQGGDAHAA